MTRTRGRIDKTKPQAPARAAQIVREYGPFAGADRINGVTHDGHRVWAATGSKLVAFDPESGQLARTLERAGDAGTAFDGTHLYQIAAARIEASARGFALTPRGERAVVVLVPPIDGDQASLLALLADGAAWSTSALALALGASQRTVQRALVELEAAGRVRSIGRARAQRWLSPPLAGFTTILLLPAALPPG